MLSGRELALPDLVGEMSRGLAEHARKVGVALDESRGLSGAEAGHVLPDQDLGIGVRTGPDADRRDVQLLGDLLRDLAGEGRTVVISSHVLAEVAQTVDRVVIVHQGRLRFAGTLRELTDSGASLEAAFLRLTGAPADLPISTDAR